MQTIQPPILARDPRADLLNIEKGTCVTYHTGHLAADKADYEFGIPAAALAWKLYEQGRVALVQKRLKDPDTTEHASLFAYIAIGR